MNSKFDHSTMRILNTVLSLGINLLIERLGLDPRLRYIVWALIAANEVRGLCMIYAFGDAAIGAVSI